MLDAVRVVQDMARHLVDGADANTTKTIVDGTKNALQHMSTSLLSETAPGELPTVLEVSVSRVCRAYTAPWYCDGGVQRWLEDAGG